MLLVGGAVGGVVVLVVGGVDAGVPGSGRMPMGNVAGVVVVVPLVGLVFLVGAAGEVVVVTLGNGNRGVLVVVDRAPPLVTEVLGTGL